MLPRATTHRERWRRLQRLDQLQRRERLSAREDMELEQLVAWRDGMWRSLPRAIDAARHRLEELQRFASATGLGPC